MEKIWFALVGLKTLKGNEMIPEHKGAYTRIACKLSDKKELQPFLNDIFKYYHFEVIDITDIQAEETLNLEDQENKITQELISEINKGRKFAWSTFHTW